MDMRSVVRLTTVTVLVLALGLHWVVLQTIAWTGMIINYSRDASFSQAVSRTFDGQHPCSMCTVIKKARAEQKQHEQEEPVKPGTKLDLALVWECPASDFFCKHERMAVQEDDAPSRSYAPPKPRPRPA